MKPNPILIVGSIALDTIETPYGNHKDLLGGAATYAMLAAAKKVPIHICGIVGDDFPDYAHKIYQQNADELTDFLRAEGPTFRWGGRYHKNMDHRDTLFTDLGVFENFNPELSKVNKKIRYVFLANNHPDLQWTALNQVNKEAIVVVDTMNLWINTTLDELMKVLSKTDILLINDSESELLTGMTDLGKSAVKIFGLGPKTVIIKQGSKGASVFTEKETFSVGVFPVENLLDTTGAGDTFGGGFIASLADGGTVLESVIYGSAMASICVEGFGVKTLLTVTEDEIQTRVDYLMRTVSA